MKKLLLASFITISVPYFSQTISDLKFDSNPVEAEGHYVAITSNEAKNAFSLGYIYFDESAGYTFRNIGYLVETDKKLKVVIPENYKYGMMIARIGNFNLKTAVLDKKMISKLGLEEKPKWLENYKSSKSSEEKVLNRASFLNAANNPNLALPLLTSLQKKEYKSEKFYFELAFSYNALSNFAEAEKVCLLAQKNKKADELVYKEYLYSLVSQSKFNEADTFLSTHLDVIEKDNNKFEVLFNLVNKSAEKLNFKIAEKWLRRIKDEPNFSRYDRQISALENKITINQNKIQ